MSETSSGHSRPPARRITPFGGTRRARFFTGADQVDAAAPELLIDENAVCRPHGALGFAEAGLDADAATACALPAGSGVALGAFCGAALPMFLSLIAQDPSISSQY